MIVLLDTSTGLCRLVLIDGDNKYEHEWQADRKLARELLAYIRDRLSEHDKKFDDISGIAVMRGPGSFTGLRIGMTVANTLAEGLAVPIVGETGENWKTAALARLRSGENDRIVLPEYGGSAHITKPRK